MFHFTDKQMKNYKIILGGRGADVFVHPVTEHQKEQLRELGVGDDDVDMDFDKLNEILGVDSWDYADESYTGSYTGDSCHIAVYDGETLVWASSEDDMINEGETSGDYKYIDKGDVLVIEHYVKGTFKEYNLPIEGEFDISKLTYKLVDIHEEIEVITALKYDNTDLDDYEWGDYWSKGTFFYLF